LLSYTGLSDDFFYDGQFDETEYVDAEEDFGV
jgi:hypothetical protein